MSTYAAILVLPIFICLLVHELLIHFLSPFAYLIVFSLLVLASSLFILLIGAWYKVCFLIRIELGIKCNIFSNSLSTELLAFMKEFLSHCNEMPMYMGLVLGSVLPDLV